MATSFGTVDELVGEFGAIEVDALSFEAASVALYELSLYIENVEIPLRGVKKIVRDDMKDRFDSETAPNGSPWFALDPEYAKKKQAYFGFEHPILTGKTKELRTRATDEAAFSISGESLFYNTSELPDYWRVHQEGSEGFGATFVQIGEENVLMRTPGEGDQNIPPRPYIGLSDEAEAKILELFDIWFSAGLEQASKQFMVSSVGTLHARTPQGRIGERIIF